MSYYPNIEFNIPFPANTDGTVSRFPAMGYYYSNSNSFPSINSSEYASLKSPGGSVQGRNFYSFLYLKGAAYKEGQVGDPVSGYTCKFCLDSVYSPLTTTSLSQRSNDAVATNIFPTITNAPENAYISYTIRVGAGSIRFLLQTQGTSIKPFHTKGIYLFI